MGGGGVSSILVLPHACFYVCCSNICDCVGVCGDV